MSKKTVLFILGITTIFSFVGFSTLSFAETKHSPVTVGILTEIDGTNLTVLARDNNTYKVYAGNAKIVTGFLGYWSKPSSLSNMQVTDTLTILGETDNLSIIASEVAHNKTPKNRDMKIIQNVEPIINTSETDNSQTVSTSSSVIENIKDGIKDFVGNLFSGTSTEIASSSASTSSSTDFYIDVEGVATDTLNTATTSIVENVINAVSDAIGNVLDAVVSVVSGGEDNSASSLEGGEVVNMVQ